MQTIEPNKTINSQIELNLNKANKKKGQVENSKLKICDT